MALLDLAATSKMEIVIIRPPMIYGLNAPGNFHKLKQCILNRVPLPIGKANHNSRNFIALPNLLDFICCCIENPKAANEIFVVADEECISTIDLIHYIGKALDRAPLLIPVPQFS